MTRDEAKRRRFLMRLVGGAMTMTAAPLAVTLAQEPPRPPRPPTKATKAQVHYQDSPKDVRSCGACLFFERPNACTVMEGEVIKNGWCDLYSLFD